MALLEVSLRFCWQCRCGWLSPNGLNPDRPASVAVNEHRQKCSHPPVHKDPIRNSARWEVRTLIEIVRQRVCACEQWEAGPGVNLSQESVNAFMRACLQHDCIYKAGRSPSV